MAKKKTIIIEMEIEVGTDHKAVGYSLQSMGQSIVDFGLFSMLDRRFVVEHLDARTHKPVFFRFQEKRETPKQEKVKVYHHQDHTIPSIRIETTAHANANDAVEIQFSEQSGMKALFLPNGSYKQSKFLGQVSFQNMRGDYCDEISVEFKKLISDALGCPLLGTLDRAFDMFRSLQ